MIGPSQFRTLLAIRSIGSKACQLRIMEEMSKKGDRIYLPHVRQLLLKLREKGLVTYDGEVFNAVSGKHRKTYKVTEAGERTVKEVLNAFAE